MSNQNQSPRAGIDLILDRIATDATFRQHLLDNPTAALGGIEGLNVQEPADTAGYMKPLCGPYSCAKSCTRTCNETYR